MSVPRETATDAATPPDEARASTFCPQAQRRFVLIAAILASSLGFIDGSVISIAIPAIRADLGATLAQAQWVSNAYMLMLSALILAGGALGDRFGLRHSFAAGIAVFVAASLLCAFAPTPEFLIAARSVQGLGAAVMVPGSLAIIAKAYPKGERGRAIGIWAAASALTTALGPAIGGLVLSLGDSVWRWIFAINVPLGAIAIYLLLFRVPADPPASARRIDIAGALLAVAALGAFSLGLTFISGELEMPVPYLPGVLIVGGVALAGVFVAWEWRHPEPMMDLALFREGTFSGANVATFFLYAALSAVLFYLPMLMITAWGIAESLAGLIFLPLSALIALLSGPVGKLSDRIGPRLPMATGSAIVAVSYAGMGLMTEYGVHAFWTGVLPLMVLMGLGMALVVSPLSIAVMTAIDDEDTGAASGINNAVARIAGLVAVAALGSVVALRYAGVAGLSGGLPEFGQPVGPDISAEMDALRVLASDKAFAAVAWISAVCCLAAAAAAWLTAPGKGAKKAETPGTG
jgi:EmrB/QacA subfamily drug resistance transporter